MNRAILFFKDVRTELSRVTWPSRDELTHSTVIVIVTTVMLSAFVGLVNLIISRALGWILVGVR
jgi:preprotein translocase subunit SecE